uniref:30S ribosomal protein S2 n=1 Tax=Monodopsis sp. MarTras21 TaxID=1745953 RepID=A0A140F2Z7_9STRA|nr:30S ribosomal protein S2 [Monodopsis sp. MarTras21]
MKNLQKNLNQFVTQKFVYYGLHLGSIKLKWNPEFKPFLTSFRNKFCLINLNFTLYYLKRTLKVLLKVVMARKKILFVGSPVGLEKEFARLCLRNKHYFLDRGLYGFFSDYKKKYYQQGKLIEQSPALIVLFEPLENSMVLDEIKSLDIPIIAFINSDDDYSLIDYFIPANVKSQKGGLFVYNLFHHLFLIESLNSFSSASKLKSKKQAEISKITRPLKKNLNITK